MNKITTSTCSQSLGSLMRNAWVWNMIWIWVWGVGWSGCVAVCGVGADFPERKGGSNPQVGRGIEPKTFASSLPAREPPQPAGVEPVKPLPCRGWSVIGGQRTGSLIHVSDGLCLCAVRIGVAVLTLPSEVMSIRPAHYGGSPIA